MAKIAIPEEVYNAIQSDDLKQIATKDESSGAYVLDVVPATFRDTNITLKQQLEDRDRRIGTFTSLIGTDDLEVAKKELVELRGLKEKVDNKKLVEDSSFEDALKTRTNEMRQIHENQQRQSARAIEEKERLVSDLQSRLDDNVLSTELQLAVVSDKSGVRPEAFPDILHRAKHVFKVESGNLVARDAKGEQIYGEDANPLNVNGWIKRLTEEAPHFLKGTSGGGAAGGRGANTRYTPDDMAGMDQKTFEALRKEQQKS